MSNAPKDDPLTKQIRRALGLIGEHADTVVIIATVKGTEIDGETKLVGHYIGNQFAAAHMCGEWSPFATESGEDEDDDDGEEVIK